MNIINPDTFNSDIAARAQEMREITKLRKQVVTLEALVEEKQATIDQARESSQASIESLEELVDEKQATIDALQHRLQTRHASPVSTPTRPTRPCTPIGRQTDTKFFEKVTPEKDVLEEVEKGSDSGGDGYDSPGTISLSRCPKIVRQCPGSMSEFNTNRGASPQCTPPRDYKVQLRDAVGEEGQRGEKQVLVYSSPKRLCFTPPPIDAKKECRRRFFSFPRRTSRSPKKASPTSTLPSSNPNEANAKGSTGAACSSWLDDYQLDSPLFTPSGPCGELQKKTVDGHLVPYGSPVYEVEFDNSIERQLSWLTVEESDLHGRKSNRLGLRLQTDDLSFDRSQPSRNLQIYRDSRMKERKLPREIELDLGE